MKTTSRFSRRKFGKLVAAAPLGASVASPQAAPPAEELRQANQRRAASAEALARFELPMAVEPAFVFRPL